MDNTEFILIELLNKKVEKNGFAKIQKYESAAYCRDQEKKIELVFYNLVREHKDYSEFKCIDYGFDSFQRLLEKYLDKDYNFYIDNTFESYNLLLKRIQLRIDRDKKLNELGI
jgi:hypothetical protein